MRLLVLFLLCYSVLSQSTCIRGSVIPRMRRIHLVVLGCWKEQ